MLQVGTMLASVLVVALGAAAQTVRGAERVEGTEEQRGERKPQADARFGLPRRPQPPKPEA